MSNYILFNKPYGVICQFSPHDNHPTLANFNIPKNVYPVGRLDTDSEGLLILTDDGVFQNQLIEPRYGHSRTYLVQVENVPSMASLQQLEKGVLIDGVQTKPAKAILLNKPPDFPERSKPIRFRKNIPTAWIELTLTEGRNRQVRRMTAVVGHPTLRLIRTKILFLTLEGLEPGKWRELKKDELTKLKTILH